MLEMAKRTGALALAIALGLLVTGCGSGGTGGAGTVGGEYASVDGPHGGRAFTLPGERGYVEVVPESGTSPDRKLVAYFLGPDLSTPLQGASGVSAELEPEFDPPRTVSLTEAAPGTFETPPVRELSGDMLTGTLTGTIGGESFSVPFALQ
ncbi:hypothetical protein BH23PLA1_BH23PLA1_28000 [soil metagenome]